MTYIKIEQIYVDIVRKPSEFTDSYPELIGFSTGHHPEGLYRDE